MLAILWFLSLGIEGKTQDIEYSKNSIYFELFGNGGLYSVNYERNFHSNIDLRIGFSFYSEHNSDLFGTNTYTIWTTTVPLTLTWLSGKKANHFEIGGGTLFGKRRQEYDSSNLNDNSTTIIDLTAFVGYRYQPRSEGILFRIGLTPFVPIKGNYPSIYISGGISFGLHF
jgi:hypothetical protein